MPFYHQLRIILSWKSLAISIAALIVLFVVAALVKFSLSYWLDRYTPKLEQAVAEATGFNTRIEGGISAKLFPVPAVSIRGITLDRKDKQSLLTAKELDLSFELLPLLDREFHVNSIVVSELHLQLPANEKGALAVPSTKFGTIKKPASGFALKLDSFDRFELRHSEFSVISPSGKTLHYLKDANLILHPANTASALTIDSSKKLSGSAFLQFQQARIGQLVLGQSRLKASYQPGRLSVDIQKSELFDGIAEGKIVWQFAADAPSVNATLSLANMSTSKSAALFQRKPFVNGRLNMEIALTGNPSSRDSFLRSAAGTVEVNGADLDLLSVDLDQIVEKIIKSQNYNLVDAAAYFFVGPLGMSTTKGFDYANLLTTIAKPGAASSKILRIRSVWTTADGIATAQDVALETQRYRLALKGRLNLIKSEFDGINIAVIDNRGCAIVKQRLDGPMKSPRAGKVNFLLALTQPVLDALGKSAKRLVGDSCEPFYTGALLPEKAGTVTSPTKEEPADRGAN
jgi:hypothetical protein